MARKLIRLYPNQEEHDALKALAAKENREISKQALHMLLNGIALVVPQTSARRKA